MGGEEADDLFRGDAHGDGAADGLAADFAGDHVGIAGGETAEKLQDGDLEQGGCVGVHPVVGFNYDVPVVGTVGRRMERGREIDGGGAEGTSIGGKGCGETCGMIAGRFGRGLIDDPIVAKVEEHLGLRRGQVCLAIGLTEFKATEHEEK